MAAAGRADEKRPTRKARDWLKGAVEARTPDRSSYWSGTDCDDDCASRRPQSRTHSLPRSGCPSPPRRTPASRERRRPARARTMPASLRGRRCARRSGRTRTWSPATWSARSSRSSRAKWPTGSNSNLCTRATFLAAPRPRCTLGHQCMFAEDAPSKGGHARTPIEAPPAVECAAVVALDKSAAGCSARK